MTLPPHLDQRNQSVDTQTNIGYVDKVIFQAPRPVSVLSIPQQIPAPPRDFTGREDDIKELLEKFGQGATITGLRGMGGVGKTALALLLAERLSGDYSNGQLFLNMLGTSKSPLKPEDVMAHIIRSYLGADAPLPKDLNGIGGLYRSVLFGKKALILLDNAASREQVEPLLPPKNCALLVTSRQKFALPGLAEKDLDVLPLEDAKKLLLEISPRISDHAEELAKLCGCLPIALRNAAYALKEKPNLSQEGYIERLADAKVRLQLVDASLRTSYELLTSELQKLWSMLSIFPADFNLEGAAAIWKMERIPAEDALGELVRWSLVDYLPSATNEAGRYRLHDLAHDFSNSRLTAVESENALERHSKHYRDLLWESEHLYQKRGHFVAEGLELFNKDWNNILTGQKWAFINIGKSFEITQFCSDYAGAGGILSLGLQLHPHIHIEWLNAALLAARKMKNKAAEGTHLGNLGRVYSDLGDAFHAIEYQELAIKIFHEIGDRQRAASHIGNLGLSYSHLGEYGKALKCHEEALAIAREYKDRFREGIQLGNIGLAYYALGDFRKAIEYHNKALEIARENKNIIGEGNNLGNLGLAYHDLGDIRKAITYYEEALEISQSIKDSRSEEKDLSNLGLAYLDLGNAERAIDYFKRALIISRKIGDKRFEGSHIGNIGLAYFFLGDIKKAIKFTERTLVISREIGDRSQEGEALCVLGDAFADLMQTQKAIEYYEMSLGIVRKIGDRRCEGEVLCGLGKAYIDIGQIDKGKEHLKQSLNLFRNIKFIRGEGNAIFNISLAQEKLGMRSEAVELAKSALNIFEKIESPVAEEVKEKLKEWQE